MTATTLRSVPVIGCGVRPSALIFSTTASNSAAVAWGFIVTNMRCSSRRAHAPAPGSDRAAHGPGDHGDLPDQLGELRRGERLVAVGEGLVGLRVDLDDDPV